MLYQVARPLTMKKDGIQTRNRKLSAKVFIQNIIQKRKHIYVYKKGFIHKRKFSKLDRLKFQILIPLRQVKEEGGALCWSHRCKDKPLYKCKCKCKHMQYKHKS